MAEFRSSAQEGSFSSNAITIPDEVKKLQNEANRQLQGMNDHQAYLEKQRAYFQESRRASHQMEREGAKLIHKVEQDGREAAYNEDVARYKRLLKQEQDKNKLRVEPFKLLADFSQTALDITTGIMETNQENQKKAINQIAFKHGLSFHDLKQVQELDSSITKSEYQRSKLVQKYLADGRSQEFIDVVYDHLVKGGGYRNYVQNSNVLTKTANDNLAVLEEIGLLDVSPEEKRKLLTQEEMAQRAELRLGDEYPGQPILEQAYNPIIRQGLRRINTQINGQVREKVEESARVDLANTVNKVAWQGGKLNAQGVLALEGSSPSAGGLKNIVSILAPQLNTLDDINDLRNAKFEKDGKVVSIATHGFSDAQAILNNRERVLRGQIEAENRRQDDLLNMKSHEAMLAKAAELTQDNDFSQVDLQEVIAAGDAVHPLRDTSNDSYFKRQTTNSKLTPRMQEILEEKFNSYQLTEDFVRSAGLPQPLYDAYINKAKQQDKTRNSAGMRGFRDMVSTQIEQMAQDSNVFKFIAGKPNSHKFEFFVDEIVKQFKNDYARLIDGDPTAALAIIKKDIAVEVKARLDSRGSSITNDYNKYYFGDGKTKSQAEDLQRLLDQSMKWKALPRAEQRKPESWVAVYGEARINQEAESIKSTGNSDLFRSIGMRSGMTQLQVNNKLAEIMDTVNPVEYTTMDMLAEQLPRAQQWTFTTDLTTWQQQIRDAEALLSPVRNTPPPVRGAFRTSTRGPANQALADLIMQGEGGWESANKGNAGDTPGGIPGLSKMTIGQVMDLQSQGWNAMGGPQFIGTTLPIAMRDAGLTESDVFSPANQVKMLFALMYKSKRPRLAAYLNGTSDDLNAAHEDLSLEWASIQGPSGAGSYDYDSAGNYAHTSGAQARQLLIQAREENLR